MAGEQRISVFAWTAPIHLLVLKCLMHELGARI